MYYYFFDLNETLIDRYPAKIAKEICEISDTNNFVFIFSQKHKDAIPKNIPEGSKYFYIPVLSAKRIESLFAQYPPKSLTTIAQRIPDMLMLSVFNRKNIPTFIVQHGLWSDRLERISLIPLLVSKFAKFISYVFNVGSICRINKIPFIYTIIDLYKFLLRENLTIPETRNLHHNNLRANKAFVFDKSWDSYYINKYGYKQNDLIYIGNPDMLLLRGLNLSKKEDAVCYLCQSLVEDGRYTIKKYKEFLEILNNEVADKKKLIIKLHQRSNKKLYKIFENNKNVVLTNDLPLCHYYIGHYTGLLGTVKHITDNILIWKLPEHHTPEYFFQFGKVVTDSITDLKSFINNGDQESYISSISREIEIKDSIKIITENIIKYSM